MASELRSSIDRVLTWVGWIIGPVGLLVLNAQIIVTGGYATAFSSGSWQQAVVNTIAALTAMIPLGLVLMTSIAFAVGASRLARRQVLVNELPAVEGLARVDVVCLDKTGTLTVGDIVFDAEHTIGGASPSRADEWPPCWPGMRQLRTRTRRPVPCAPTTRCAHRCTSAETSRSPRRANGAPRCSRRSTAPG